MQAEHTRRGRPVGRRTQLERLQHRLAVLELVLDDEPVDIAVRQQRIALSSSIRPVGERPLAETAARYASVCSTSSSGSSARSAR